MNFTAAVDISSFIWSKDDFNAHKHNYYHLIGVIPTIFDQIEKCKVPLLFRQDLFHLIQAEFPYSEVNNISRDYEKRTFTFLINTVNNWHLYNKMDRETTSSTPTISKAYFSPNIQEEIQCQIDHIYYHNHLIHKFITYKYFYNCNSNLVIFNRQNESIEIDTLNYNTEEDIIKFFDSQKIKFEHNPKHDIYNAGGKISPLSCFNERLNDPTRAQQLFDSSVFLDGRYYNYDSANEVYVVFLATSKTVVHGFDLSDEGASVPNTIKAKFNKNGRRF